MKTIILSPGPSLADYIPQPCDMLLGVNRAATRFPVDAWVCGDLPLIEKISDEVIGSPKLISYDVSVDNLNDRKWKWRGEIFRWSLPLSEYLHPSVVNWPFTTFTSAIVYAAFSGATEIEVYGADWCGTLDFDGVQAGKNRSDARWQTERGLFDGLVAHFEPRGIKLVRCWLRQCQTTLTQSS